MKVFTELFAHLDQTNTNEKAEAMVEYFHLVPVNDAARAIYFYWMKTQKAYFTCGFELLGG